MGDLSNEYQDAVIAANYVNTDEEATALEVVFTTPEGTTIEQIEKILQEAGIDGSSFHFDTNELAITCFSQEEVYNITNKLKDKYEYKEYNAQNSRYLDNESRRNLYKTWLKTKSNTQDRSLYNACSKALAICEAAGYTEEVNSVGTYTCFSQEEVDNIINKLKDKYEYKEYTFQNSRYLDDESRRNIFETWLKTKSGI